MPVALLPSRGVLSINGPDRVSFLQGLVSNDVTRVAEGVAVYAALLTAQGKYLHDFLIVGRGEALLIDGERDRLPDLARRLKIFRLRAKVDIEILNDAWVAAGWDGAAPIAGDALTFADPRLTELGHRAIGTGEPPTSDATAEDYDRHRLTLGVPDGSRDLVVEKSILLENGFDELHGVDWKKGCYIGQELTARTKYRGLVKKRLVPVTIEGPVPEPGAIITAGGREVGEMRGARDGRGLALLRLDALADPAPPPFVVGDTVVRPHAPSWRPVDSAL